MDLVAMEVPQPVLAFLDPLELLLICKEISSLLILSTAEYEK